MRPRALYPTYTRVGAVRGLRAQDVTGSVPLSTASPGHHPKQRGFSSPF
jgi:hypothetical protein